MVDQPEKMDGYIRVSRVMGREAPGYISPDVQRDAIARWAEYKGIEIADWLKDEDWSGGTQNRPVLMRGIERAISGETGGIVAWKIDRFSRATEGGLRDLHRLQAAGARLAFVVEDIDTATTYGKMVYTILLSVSEAFRESVKAGWIETKKRAVLRGAYGARTPWGYVRNADGTLSPHPERAPIVAEAFRLAANGDLQAPLAYLRDVAPERNWNATKLRRLLSQRVYRGEIHYQGVESNLTAHAEVVAKKMFAAAQSTPAARKPREDFPLSGVLTCGTCGNAMVGGRGGTGQRTYRCSATQSSYRGDKCLRGATVTATLIEEYLEDIVGQLQDLLIARTKASSPVDIGRVAQEWQEAEEELDAFAGDLTARRVLGAGYHAHLQARMDDRDRKYAAYVEAARASQATTLSSSSGLAAKIVGAFETVLVRPGRGVKIADRVTLYPLDDDGGTGVLTA